MNRKKLSNERVASPSSPDRRKFLRQAGGITAASIAAGAIAVPGLLGPKSIQAQAPPPPVGCPEGCEMDPQSGINRVNTADQIRRTAADNEQSLGVLDHPCNLDEKNIFDTTGAFYAAFAKTLPHDDFGEVEPDIYCLLLRDIGNGSFNAFEDVRLRQDPNQLLKLANPLGGLAFNMEGPDSPAAGIPVPGDPNPNDQLPLQPPPTFSSPEMGAEMAELYWMAVARDVLLANFGTDQTIADAVFDLSKFPGYKGPTPITPKNVFRVDYPGVTDGPMISQFLLRSFRYDGIRVEPRTRVARPVNDPLDTGIDFLTFFQEWLAAQRGFPPLPGIQPGTQLFEDAPRVIRSMRDLGQNANQDTIYSAYFRAALILMGAPNPADEFLGGLAARVNPGNPYNRSLTQTGFATFGLGHLTNLLGCAQKAERHTWFEKWNVHRYQRPEVFAGRVNAVLAGPIPPGRIYPIDQQLLKSPVIGKIRDLNALINSRRGVGNGKDSFLLPQLGATGSPTHPSFPAGHAISAGASVTILKAWFDESFAITNPLQPRADGTDGVEPYIAPPGEPALTVGGELNKLAHNLTFGRNMSGVHWRADGVQGNRQGEEVAIRILKEARATYPENPVFNGFSFHRFDGTPVTI